jgi:hypothetical protein
MATLIGTYDFVLFTGDMDFLNSIWEQYIRAMNFVISKIDSTGMMSVTGSGNWGRTASSSGHATDGNMLLYGCLITGATVAEWKGNASLASTWLSRAEALKTSVNRNNWDDSHG